MSDEPVIPLRQLRQVGWRSIATGEFCTCPPFEVSPHANSDPVWVIDSGDWRPSRTNDGDGIVRAGEWDAAPLSESDARCPLCGRLLPDGVGHVCHAPQRPAPLSEGGDKP